jgi:cardiolipin synthase
MIRDRGFNRVLRERLQWLIDHSCNEIDPQRAMVRSWWRLALSYLVFHVLRRFPTWAGWLPAHAPKLAPAGAFAASDDTLPITVQAVTQAGDRSPPQPWAWRGGADVVTEGRSTREPDYSV